ncbi:type II toxin-antitoxin system ParD family antitoxin [Chryseobacterium sp. Ch-15]|uniref:Type II toxin-antitoxin system ParD family antitoxin n=1 Tax=Chryseobacterium muglaense TaxID=2893752 RepID=A0A9Q3UVD7_9FLAO|nr:MULTISPECIES: type II toxin-antitoxin system ParD family antitoxin [Chryseobacterium]MBD3902992.1 type II toxin-antitoxin system ParD family antitoxin [Chryseobacterium muglaense]MBO6186172.1 type II toxin-antitoxin system ParD family antitoxin [Chryseobacterium sp.]MCC9035824.1 type II toxin-antitoxin system ParD family antitoxin [Chryseobacterium muglaense]MCM2554447.1 type II toxin-antitoxin system ParD family antitoxin [Chryseobacterium muglaense]
MNVSFTKKQTEYISEQVESGDFQNASEVVRDALRLHEIYRHRLIQDLKAEIEKGWNDKSSSRSVKDIIQAKKQKKDSNV